MFKSFDKIHQRKSSIERAGNIARALRHDLRLEMLRLMDEKGKVTVTDLFTELNIVQSVCSQQLMILRECGLVKTAKEGKFTYYSVDDAAVTVILNSFSQLTAISRVNPPGGDPGSSYMNQHSKSMRSFDPGDEEEEGTKAPAGAENGEKGDEDKG